MFGPDDNIFSFLTQQPVGLDGVSGGNVLQALAQPPQAVAPPPPPPPREAPKAAEPPKRRRSLLDTIGRISDVIAKVGGADALYQPTLDAREDRELALGDHGRKVTAEELKIATDKFALGDSQNTRLGQAARGAKAILSANPNADPATVWSAIAQHMQLSPEETASVAQELPTNPAILDGLISGGTDPKLLQSKYGGTIVYAKDPTTGKIRAYQPSLADDPARDILPEGVEAIDPPKTVDLGGTTAVIGTRSGRVNRVLPNSEKPGMRGGVPINERPGYRGGRPIAPAPGKEGADNSAFITTAKGNLDELRGIYTDLHKMGAMVSPAQSKDKNVVARIRASGIGQTLEGAVGTEAQTKRDRIASIRPGLMQSLAKATGMTGKQLDSNADVKLFMQTVTDPTKSYEANIEAINGLERFLRANAKKPAAAAPAPSANVRPKGKDGWTIVKVQ
jgi:hypothetical protein